MVTPDLATQKDIARQIQMLVWRDVPFIPLGLFFPLTAFKKTLDGVQKGQPQFFNVHRA